MAETRSKREEDEQDARFLQESAELRLPPISMGTLASMGFFSVYGIPLHRLWKIYLLLIQDHNCQVKDLLRWSRCQVFPQQAGFILGPDSEEARWLLENYPKWNPHRAYEWRYPGFSWYKIIESSITLGGICDHSDQLLHEKQNIYVAYVVLSQKYGNLLGDPGAIETSFDVWHDFGFTTCATQTQMQDLKYYYELALFIRGYEANTDGEFTPFEDFYKQYRENTLIPWMNDALKKDNGQEFDIRTKFPWLERFLSKAEPKKWSVWRLRQGPKILARWSSLPAQLQAAVRDYGLDLAITREHFKTVEDLLEVYKKIMDYGPEKLHQAREEGRLEVYASSLSQKPGISIQPWMTEIFSKLDLQKQQNQAANTATGEHLGGHGQ